MRPMKKKSLPGERFPGLQLKFIFIIVLSANPQKSRPVKVKLKSVRRILNGLSAIVRLKFPMKRVKAPIHSTNETRPQSLQPLAAMFWPTPATNVKLQAATIPDFWRSTISFPGLKAEPTTQPTLNVYATVVTVCITPNLLILWPERAENFIHGRPRLRPVQSIDLIIIHKPWQKISHNLCSSTIIF